MLIPRVLPYGQVRTIQIFAIFLGLTSLILIMRLYSRPPRDPYEYTEGRTSPWHDWSNTTVVTSDEVAYLRFLADTYGLTREVPWFSRRIQTKYGASKRLSMTEMSAKFMTADFRRVRPDDEYLELEAEKSIKLSFAKSSRPHQIDASGLLFGISTTASRLSYSNYSLVRDWERWLTDGRGASNGATLLLGLHQSSKEEAGRVGRILQERGIDATVTAEADGKDTPARYTELIRRLRDVNEDLVREGNGKTFFALVDDDVFFPSMAKLLGKLSKFSPKKEFYIGAPSEKSSDWVIDQNTTLTYGGGAVFLTPPMVARLTDLPCLQPSTSASSTQLWDEHVYKCVSAETKVDFHVLPSFYSPDDDLYGDVGAGNAGYGGGLQPLTLHHYKTWHRFDAGRGHQVTAACGEDCFLQRFRFKDDWVLVNGYTLSQYPEGVEMVPLRKSAKFVSQSRKTTSSDEPARLTVASRLVVDTGDRPADMKVIAWRGPKRTWRLLDSRITGSGEVWQAYVKRKGASNSYGDVGEWSPGDAVHTDEGPSNEDSVIVLIWESS